MDFIKEGKTINGKYQIIEKIGEGATSYVYLAYDLVMERNVSLKVLKEINLTEKKIKAFKKEAHAISILNHENIIKIYEIDSYAGTYYIAQEYIDGMSLKEYIETTELIPTQKAVKIIVNVLEGLAHAHEKKVIHKDIKSQNILLGVNGEIKITDFGIADILEDDETKTQSLMGTPQYVAPEVLNKGESTYQTDIYSTGILLYELLIGHAPFYGEKPTIIILKQLNQPIPSVKQQRDSIPQSLENVLIKATAKKLSNRYPDVDEMIDDLRTCFNISRINEAPLEMKNDFEFQEMGSFNLSKVKEEEVINEKRSKKRNYTWMLISVFALLFIIVFINVIVFFNTKEQLMPDLTGKNYKDATTSLEALNVEKQNIEIKYEENKDIEKNLVIKSVPSKGLALDNKQVILTVSKGMDTFKLNNYIGTYKEDGQIELENLGLKVNFIYENSKEEKGKIVQQIPEENNEVYPGDQITLIISNGLKTLKVQNFIGKKQEEFEKWRNENNLNETIFYECSNTLEDGVLIKQDPKDGAEIEEGTNISITISNGKCGQSFANEKSKTNDSQLIKNESYTE